MEVEEIHLTKEVEYLMTSFIMIAKIVALVGFINHFLRIWNLHLIRSLTFVDFDRIPGQPNRVSFLIELLCIQDFRLVDQNP
jgi:hypothetical protein